ncbi:hypothetical protein AB832_07235 [Flavobacteriaceae bacterium (ex Bugula neritina AB1)]|nr:hypothetical protein AB832_07235 [Flavobacteriaceae bacterium (ex Bugula neritina AB1)]
MHWATRYIGIKWIIGGDSITEGFDCWGLFRHVQKEHYNLELPRISLREDNYHLKIKTFLGHEERHNWYKVEEPHCGDAVLMTCANYPSHIGVYIKDINGVLHTTNPLGVLFQTKKSLSLSNWKILNYYRHAKNET